MLFPFEKYGSHSNGSLNNLFNSQKVSNGEVSKFWTTDISNSISSPVESIKELDFFYVNLKNWGK